MTPEERQVITDIFERLKAAENHPRDPEAEKLIADCLASQPYAPYAMAQSIYVNEQAVANLNERVAELERHLQEMQEQAPPQSGGFLSGLFGGGPRNEPARADIGAAPSRYPQPRQGFGPASQGYPQPGPAPGYGPQPGPWGAQPQGGGFLGNAMSTAAGVAGGVMLANALTSAFSHRGAAAGSGLGSFGTGTSDTAPAQGFTGFEPSGRQDVPSSGGGGSTTDRDDAKTADASFDDSNDDSSMDEPDLDDPGSFDDGDFSGNV
jgi:uncharacterized protein